MNESVAPSSISMSVAEGSSSTESCKPPSNSISTHRTKRMENTKEKPGSQSRSPLSERTRPDRSLHLWQMRRPALPKGAVGHAPATWPRHALRKEGKGENGTLALYVGKPPGTQLSVLFYIVLSSVGEESGPGGVQDLLPELLHPPWNAPLAGDPVFLYPLLRDDGSILHPTRTVGRAGNPVPHQPN